MDFSNLKVLVIGDICLDIVEEGASTRLSPEAPVPVILNPTKKYSLGMMANVAMNLKSLGADVETATVFVDDKYGQKIMDLLYENSLADSSKFNRAGFYASKDCTTTVKKRIIANGQQIARLDREYREEDLKIARVLEMKLKKLEEQGKTEFDAVIISDYNKGVINEESWKLIKDFLTFYEYNGPIFIDTKKKDIEMFKGCIITPNSKELYEILDYYNFTHPSELAEFLDSYFIETRSENGACIHGKNFRSYSPAYTQNVVDVCGAGDTFMAAYVLYISKHNNLDAALGFANYCCSKVVQKKGTSVVELSEVMDFESKRYGSER